MKGFTLNSHADNMIVNALRKLSRYRNSYPQKISFLQWLLPFQRATSLPGWYYWFPIPCLGLQLKNEVAKLTRTHQLTNTPELERNSCSCFSSFQVFPLMWGTLFLTQVYNFCLLPCCACVLLFQPSKLQALLSNFTKVGRFVFNSLQRISTQTIILPWLKY